MRILVAGPESSGTRMLCAILARTGADITHSSPAFKTMDGWRKYNPTSYDKVILLVRNGIWNARSMVERSRFRDERYADPHVQIIQDIYDVIKDLGIILPLYVVTYESLVYETEHCISSLCETLGLPTPVGYDEVRNGNEKFWGEGWEGDDRDLTERLT